MQQPGSLSLQNYILRRVLLVVPTVLGAGIVVFFLIRILPGDICLVRWVDYGQDLKPELLELCRDNLGLNDPLYLQFLQFLRGVLTFDYGVSMWTERPGMEELEVRFALSLQLAIMATIATILISIPFGVLSAVKQNTWIDYVIRIISIGGVAVPSFWLGILIILALLIGSEALFGEPWMPPIEYVSLFSDPIANLSQLIWPVVATGYR